MVGRNFLAHPLAQQHQVLAPSSDALNLLDFQAVQAWLAQNRPDVVVHAAGKVDAGQKIVCTVTGNGLKDPQWALESAADPIVIPVDVTAAAQAIGLR